MNRYTFYRLVLCLFFLPTLALAETYSVSVAESVFNDADGQYTLLTPDSLWSNTTGPATERYGYLYERRINPNGGYSSYRSYRFYPDGTRAMPSKSDGYSYEYYKFRHCYKELSGASTRCTTSNINLTVNISRDTLSYCPASPPEEDHEGGVVACVDDVKCTLPPTDTDNYKSHDGIFTTPRSSQFVVLAGDEAATRGFQWRYTFDTPPSSWFDASFDDSAWLTARGAFERGTSDPSSTVFWPSDEPNLWVRSTFSLTSNTQKKDLMFWGKWDDNIDIYINGFLAVKQISTKSQNVYFDSPRYLGMSDQARDSLVLGQNTISARVRDYGGGAHLNLGLVLSRSMADIPISGYAKNGYFDSIIQHVSDEMSLYGISAGGLSIALDTGADAEVVASAGFGYMTKDLSRPVPRNAVFRLASLDKSPGRSAAKKLIDDQLYDPSFQGWYITKETKVFPLMNSILKRLGEEPLTGAPEPIGNNNAANPVPLRHIDTVTIDQILRQTSGINVQGGSNNFGSIIENVQWIYQQPIESHQGGFQYSNQANEVLRYLVHLYSIYQGYGDYNEYIRDKLLENSADKNFYLAWQDLNYRVKDSNGLLLEPWYATGRWFWNGEGIRNVLGGAASTDAYTLFLLDDVNVDSGWNGAMSGSQTFSRVLEYKDSLGVNRRYAFTLAFNMVGLPRGGLNSAENDIVPFIIDAIRNLPSAAWTDSSCD